VTGQQGIGLFELSGEATSPQASSLLDQVCEHFVEHAQVTRHEDSVVLESPIGTARIRLAGDRLLFNLACPTSEAMQMSRTTLAEHLFYFAGDQPLRLNWSEPASAQTPPNLYLATLSSAEMVTPAMRRLKFSCADVSPFIGGDMHVRLLVPPAGREPVWPVLRADGRIGWPQGDDALLSRAYTIRAVDQARNEVWIDFFQHPDPSVATPGADFARDAQPGTLVGLMGPGSGRLPVADNVFLAGDESALPAIARIVEELPATTRISALVEVWDESEEQPFSSQGQLDLRWLHRRNYSPGTTFGALIKQAIATTGPETFLWVACEKADIRAVRGAVKRDRSNLRNSYIAWYWSKGMTGDDDAE
jgi:NADPH-dependent ferric siderophore reductase